MRNTIFIASLAVNIALAILLLSLPKKPAALPVIIKHPQQTLRQADRHYQQQAHLYAVKEHKAKTEMAALQKELQATRGINKILLRKAKALARIADTGRSAIPTPVLLTMSLDSLERNDSLKDHLCDAALQLQETRLIQKDSLIDITANHYALAKKILEDNTSYLKMVQQQVKKEKRKKNLLKLTTLALGAGMMKVLLSK